MERLVDLPAETGHEPPVAQNTIVTCSATRPLHVAVDVKASRYHDCPGIVGRTLAILLLIVTLPLLLLGIVLVLLSSPGPVFYRQVRLGRGGKSFVIYKLRTMVADAERNTGPVWASADDIRITPIGRMLRLLNWDEIPQLINVIKGDMNIVGPRPERPEIAERLIDEIPDYAKRTLVCPGITGLAQINLPADTDLDSVRRKLLLDFEYIRTANPWMDLCIVMATAPRLVGIRSKGVASALGVYRRARLAVLGEPQGPTSKRGGIRRKRRRRVLPR